MGAITQIFRTFGDEYIARYPHMPIEHKKTIDAIINCRSGSYGVAVYQCDGCGKEHLIDRSCGNRHCPQCQYHKSRGWLDAQLERRLPGDHFLLTFTVPEQLRPFFRSHQDAAYGAMFKASSGSIKKLAKDPRFIGADLPGFTAVLHTWGLADTIPSPFASHCPRRRRVARPEKVALIPKQLLLAGQSPFQNLQGKIQRRDGKTGAP